MIMQDFKSQLYAHTEKINKDLEELITSKSIDPYGKIPAKLQDAMTYALLAGGKRIRPILCLEVMSLLKPVTDEARQVAYAIECLHTYSLVHDDLPAMDNDDMRRGMPTTHIKYDEHTAILVGDGLLTLAFQIIAGLKNLSHKTLMNIILELSRAAGPAGMVGGQSLDLDSESLNLDHNGMSTMQQMKTGALIEASCIIGGLLGDADDDSLKNIRQYGHLIGTAFQLQDDILDITGTAKETGKAVKKDVAAGKRNTVNQFGIEHARQILEQNIEASHQCLSSFGEKALFLKELASFIGTRTK